MHHKNVCLIMLDSVIRPNRSYYPQTLLEGCKNKVTRNKVENLIFDGLDSSSFDAFDNELDDGSDNGCDNDESNDHCTEI